MQITSPDFLNNQFLPVKYTCDGNSINPPLDFFDIPEGTQSLALIMDDPDAPGGDFVHWIVWNIQPDTKNIAANSVPDGATEGITSDNKAGYVAPCPPSGIHHYQFKLYALDISLSLNQSAQKSDLLAAIQGHMLDQANLTGLYQKR